MQRKYSKSNRSSNCTNHKRKLQKRLMHHKQQLQDFEQAKKAFQATSQARSALSSQAATLSSKLEAALKSQERFFKKTLKQHSVKHIKDLLSTSYELYSSRISRVQSHSSGRYEFFRFLFSNMTINWSEFKNFKMIFKKIYLKSEFNDYDY